MLDTHLTVFTPDAAQPDPFTQGHSAAQHPYGTWFDCPYTSKDPVSARKQAQWFRGWDAARNSRLSKKRSNQFNIPHQDEPELGVSR